MATQVSPTPHPRHLCALDDIEDTESAGATAVIAGREEPLILVRRGDKVWCYINRCPHVGAPLDFKPGWFLTLDKSLIQCANHGAQFEIETGYCVAGPCVGKSLVPVAVEVADGEVQLAGD